MVEDRGGRAPGARALRFSSVAQGLPPELRAPAPRAGRSSRGAWSLRRLPESWRARRLRQGAGRARGGGAGRAPPELLGRGQAAAVVSARCPVFLRLRPDALPLAALEPPRCRGA